VSKRVAWNLVLSLNLGTYDQTRKKCETFRAWKIASLNTACRLALLTEASLDLLVCSFSEIGHDNFLSCPSQVIIQNDSTAICYMHHAVRNGK
jgi:hypothetical protein